MQQLFNQDVRRIHCVGVGGIGVSALAEILFKQGFEVSGSDVEDSERLEYLRSLGVNIFVGHDAEHVKNADVVVYSSAVREENPEIVQAKAQGAMLIKRGRMLASLMQLYKGVAIAGTHGKTSTTALLAHILVHAELDPTYFIGGIPADTQSPVRIGGGDVFVAEADESDASFLYIKPKIAVVTNLECDHMSTYAGNQAQLLQSFMDFLHQVPSDGLMVLNLDDSNIQQLMSHLTAPVLTYGQSTESDYCLSQYHQAGLTGHAKVTTLKGQVSLQLNLPGLYNMENAVAAFAVADYLGVKPALIAKAIAGFSGVARRFQCHGDVLVSNKRITIIEDYGHHPTEVEAAYRATCDAFPGRRVLMIFQPHRYTRTRDLMDEFVSVLKTVKHLVLLETYAASENEIPTASSSSLCDAIEGKNGSRPYLISNMQDFPAYLESIVREEDVVLFEGAGDIGDLAALYA